MSRFALSSLLAFLAIGTALAWVVSNQLQQRQEEAAKFHAVFVTESILDYIVSAEALAEPMRADSAAYQHLRTTVLDRVMRPPVVRVKIWRGDGTILFSDDARLLGQQFPGEAEEFEEVLRGEVMAGISDLSADENLFERASFQKLFETYVPLRIGASGPPVAIAEIYTNYVGIQRDVSRLFGALVVTLLIGLAALYVLLLPIARRVGRTVSAQNRQLEEQTARLQELLDSEHQRVAELRELNRMKDDFVAAASHELRTPLTSIIGYAKTLRRPEFSDDTVARDEFLQAIERQGDRLSRLVKNLLSTANLDEQTGGASYASVALEDLAAEVVAGLGPRAARVRVLISSEVPHLLTDRSRLELVVSNLLDNALKFSPNGTTCELRAERHGDSVAISVEDRGVGIPDDQLEAVFDRFYQIDSSITRQYGGVGLGLNLVKELVRSLEGSISVKSDMGKGSTFTVSLPLVHPSSAGGNGRAGERGARWEGQPAEPARAR